MKPTNSHSSPPVPTWTFTSLSLLLAAFGLYNLRRLTTETCNDIKGTTTSHSTPPTRPSSPGRLSPSPETPFSLTEDHRRANHGRTQPEFVPMKQTSTTASETEKEPLYTLLPTGMRRVDTFERFSGCRRRHTMVIQ